MKINMSEELHFDELELDDGSEAKEDAEKEAEKSEKETQKEIDKRIDDVEDINTAEPKDLKLKIDKSNSKIKELKEGKLTLDEDDLDEAIPKDLAQAYKRSRYQGDYNADLQNATYNEVSPDEAYNIIKKQDKEHSLRILINGRLIKINNGYGDRDDRFRTNVSFDKAYVRKSGAKERDTAKMGLKHLLSIADKIYVTNEAEPEGKKDQSVIDARRLNPESKYFSGSSRNGDHGRGSRNYSGWYSDKDIQGRINRIYDEYKARKNEVASKLANGEITQAEYDQAMKVAKNDLANRLQNDYGADAFYDKKDYAARKRYRSAEDAITAPIRKYGELKNEIDNTQYSVNEYTKKIDQIKNNGSYKTREARSNMDYYKRQLNSIAAKLAELEMVIETADETDQAEINKAQAELDKYTAQLDSYKDEIKQLLRKTEGLEEFYDKIDSDKELKENFEDILESLYPNGYSADTVAELLKDKEMISEMLDME